jgi:hypothetical protein
MVDFSVDFNYWKILLVEVQHDSRSIVTLNVQVLIDLGVF